MRVDLVLLLLESTDRYAGQLLAVTKPECDTAGSEEQQEQENTSCVSHTTTYNVLVLGNLSNVWLDVWCGFRKI